MVFSAFSIANWVVYTWLAVYVYERFDTTLSQAGFSATFYVQCSSLVGIFAGGWLADTWRRRSVRGRVLTQVVGLGIAGPFLLLSGLSSSMASLITGLLMFGLGRGLYECNAMPVLCQLARPNQRSTGFGIFNFAGCIAGGAMAAASGYLKSSIGIGGVLMFSGVLLMLSALLLLLKIRPEEPEAGYEGVPVSYARHPA
jgi:dipeptide/tripeptide permease